LTGKTILPVAPRPPPKGNSKRARSERVSQASDASANPGEPAKKKQRPARGSMSERELGNLFDSHKPSIGVDESLGASFKEPSRSSRNMTTNPKPRTKPKPRKILELAAQESMDIKVEDKNLYGSSTEASVSDVPLEKSSSIRFNAPIGNLHTSRSYSQSSCGMKTPTPRMTTPEIAGKQPLTFDKPSRRRASTSKSSEEFIMPPADIRRLRVAPGESVTVVSDIQTPPPKRQTTRAKRADSVSTINSTSRPSATAWSPNAICQNSVLTYVSTAEWPDVAIDKKTGSVVRTVKAEREGVFRASGVVMGVRFVVGV
jgi:hypothetical protein